MDVLRWFLAITSLVVFLVVVQQTASRYLSTSNFINRGRPSQVVIPSKPYSDMTDGSIQANLTLSNSLFQAALLITAAVAGLLIAKDGEAGFVLAKAPEIIMFLCTSLLLLLSVVSHALYLKEISYVYALAGEFPEVGRIPDVSDDNINFLFSYQFRYLAAGAFLALLTFFSAHKLRGGGRR